MTMNLMNIIFNLFFYSQNNNNQTYHYDNEIQHKNLLLNPLYSLLYNQIHYPYQ
jgi:hypothetical protein